MKGFFEIKELNEKNRIVLPGFIEEKTKINFYSIYEDYISMYTEDDFNEKLNELYQLKHDMLVAGTNPIDVNRLIFKLETDILGYGYVQSQNRLVIPSYIVDKFKLKKVVLVGTKDHIKLFPTEEKYNEFKENVKLKKMKLK